MKAEWRDVKLNLIHPFTIARNTRTHYDSIILTLEYNGVTAYGEAVPTLRYNEDTEKVNSALATVDYDSEPFTKPVQVEDTDTTSSSKPLLYPSSIDASNIADWDLQGKILGQPLYRV